MFSLDLNELWQKALSIMEKQVSKPSFDTWLKSAKPINFNNKAIIIEVPNDFARDWLESRYYDLIKDSLEEVANQEVRLSFVLPNSVISNPETVPKTPTSINNIQHEDIFPTYLNPKYTFDTFVVGNSNRFAHAAALAVAESPARSYNPLFIYGGVGLGKTHLMQAIGHFVLENNPAAKVVYLSSEKFTNELINSIRDDKTVMFRNKYRNMDILLIDDIQFVAGKERTQEEFFHTFNALYEANKQIIISSDRPPKEILTLEERLRSRFEWGLITDIQPPDFETRIAILRKRAKSENLQVPNDVIAFIADQVRSNIRELEGALTRVILYSSVKQSQITPELASEALKDILPAQKPKPISVGLIQKVVASHFDLRIDDLKAKRRTRAVAFPRQIAMYLCREMTDSSLPKIGDEFGGRDHTTVMHACEKISTDLKENDNLQSTIKEIKNLILQTD